MNTQDLNTLAREYQILSTDHSGEWAALPLEIAASSCFISHGGVIVFTRAGREVFFYRPKEGDMIQEVMHYENAREDG